VKKNRRFKIGEKHVINSLKVGSAREETGITMVPWKNINISGFHGL
jgi:hypothetical protein